jgi:hypothetical protein
MAIPTRTTRSTTKRNEPNEHTFLLPRRRNNRQPFFRQWVLLQAVVASKLMANLEGKKAAVPGPARKKRKTKAK